MAGCQLIGLFFSRKRLSKTMQVLDLQTNRLFKTALKFTGLLASVVLLSLSVGALAQAKQDNARQFSKIVGKVITYQAAFEQRVHDELGKEIDFSRGRLTIERPNHFRWEVKQNFPQVIVADGDHLWTYEVDLEQVTIQNQSGIEENSPLLLFTSNVEDLNRAYHFAVLNTKGKPEQLLFVLKPKSEEAVFESIQVLVKNNKIVELLMTDTLGQNTSVKFNQIKINKKVDASLFRLIIPKGVDVVDLRETVQVR